MNISARRDILKGVPRVLANLTEYFRPTSLDEAAALLRRPDPTALLAGGTELTARTDLALRAVVDLTGLGMDRITLEEATLTLGATATLTCVAAHPTMQTLASGILARAVRQSAPATIRNSATVGGTLAGHKGGLEIPTVLLALNARVLLALPEPLDLGLADFFARRQDLLGRGAIITAVRIDRIDGTRGGFALVGRSPADRAIVCAAAVTAGQACRVAAGGVAPEPRLLPPSADIPDTWDTPSDFLGSAEYRRWVAPVLAQRAMAEAAGTGGLDA